MFFSVCDKTYKRLGNLKRHLKREHNWTVDVSCPTLSKGSAKTVCGSFVKHALLARDTSDAYAMGDGNRAFRNAKFEFLYANSLGHTKYRLWLFRMLAYEKAVLTPKEAFEYKWNITANLQGNVNSCIPGDNLVELQVGKIKRKLKAQGANVNFNTAQLATKTTQVIDQIKVHMDSQISTGHSKSHGVVDKSLDVSKMAHELMFSNYFKSNITLNAFKSFIDPFQKSSPAALSDWLNNNKISFSKLNEK